MADMQAGIGPFLGVFLLAHGWESGLIGTVMTIGGASGMLLTTPAGALVDTTKRKKLYVVVHQAGFNRQNGYNQAFNHAGNMVGAGLSGLLGWQFGFTAVVWLAAAVGLLSIASGLMIPGAAIDD